jgi:hypothetical protein
MPIIGNKIAVEAKLMLNNTSLFHEAERYSMLRDRLKKEFPDSDDQTLIDTLDGLTDINEMLESVVRSRDEDITLKDALKLRIEEMNMRLSRLRGRADMKKEIVAEAMDRAGIKKIEAPEFTISCRRTTPPLLVDDESAVPEKYWKAQPAKLDRMALIAALKAGESISGAILGNGGITISVRRG